MKKNMITAIALFFAMVSGCAAPGINYRGLALYESGQKLRCVVQKTLFTPSNGSVAADYGVKTVYFCCGKCVEDFRGYPGRYVETDYGKNGGKNARESSRRPLNGGGSCH